MKRVFIVHGFGGAPNGGWLPWLMLELGKRGIYACSLAMPTPKTPVVSEWIEKISREAGEPSSDIFLVGHSLGVPAVLRYLESLPEGKKIGGAVLVSGFIAPLDTENSQSPYRAIDSFTVPQINLEKVKNTANTWTVVHGAKDATVPFTQAEKITDALNAKLIAVPQGDHFSQITEPICRELPEALNAVLEILK